MKKSSFEKAAFDPSESKSLGAMTIPNLTTEPLFTPESYLALAREGFRKNELVYAAIRKKAASFAEAPLRVYGKDSKAIEEHPVRQLIKRPNPFMSEYLFWELGIIYLEHSGDFFIEKFRDRRGKVSELWPLRPDRIRIVADPMNFIAGYIYCIGGRQYPVPVEDIIHIKYPNPINDHFGLSPLRAALRALDTDNEQTDMKKVTLQNKGIPGAVVETESTILHEEDIERLRAQWEKRFGSVNRGKPAFLQKGMKLVSINQTMAELEFADLSAIGETRILMCFGVPPIIIGAKSGLDKATYANYEEARRSFYQDTICPLHNRIDDEINAGLMPEFDSSSGAEAAFDTSEVEAFQSVKESKRLSANTSWASGLMTRNEARALADLDPVPGGDVFNSTFATVLLPSNPKPGQRQVVPAPEESAPVTESGPATTTKGAFPQIRKQLELLNIALGRTRLVQAFLSKTREMAENEFAFQEKSIRKILSRSTKAMTQSEFEFFDAELRAEMEEWIQHTKGNSFALFEDLLPRAARAAADELGASFDVDPAEILSFVDGYSFKFAQRISQSSADDVRTIVRSSYEQGQSLKEIRDALETRFEDWNRVRSKTVSLTETSRAANYGAKSGYRKVGITSVQWLASSDACPYCLSLQAKGAIAIDAAFVEKDASLDPTVSPELVNNRPMVASYEAIGAPPAHPRCNCTLVPVVEEAE